MKKSKLLKSFGFASLAIFMGATGIFAFAPLGASASVAGASVVDQINAKADGENIKYAPSAIGLDPENDPVIYTTESGLEIKYGGIDLNNSLASGKPLSGYPYFTMGTYNGYAVNWVIIGRNTNVTALYTAIESYLFSVWKSNESSTFGQYFFNTQYESLTPAGTSINKEAQSKAYVSDNETISLTEKGIISNAEVPSGCVLAISECCLGYSWFNSASGYTVDNYIGSISNGNCRGSRYRYMSDSNGTSCTFYWNNKYEGTLYSAINTLYNSTLGLSTTQKNMVVGQKLNTIYANTSSPSYYMETYSTDGNTLYNFFPLAGWKFYKGSNNSLGAESFEITTYLTSNALRVAYQIGTSTTNNYYLRSNDSISSHGAIFVGTSGEVNTHRVTAKLGVRPACVLKIIGE